MTRVVLPNACVLSALLPAAIAQWLWGCAAGASIAVTCSIAMGVKRNNGRVLIFSCTLKNPLQGVQIIPKFPATAFLIIRCWFQLEKKTNFFSFCFVRRNQVWPFTTVCRHCHVALEPAREANAVYALCSCDVLMLHLCFRQSTSASSFELCKPKYKKL